MGNAASYFNYEDPTYQNYKENESKQIDIKETKKWKSGAKLRDNISQIFYF